MADSTPDIPGTLARVVREERAQLVAVAGAQGLTTEDALDCVHDACCTFLELAVRRGLPADPAEHAPFLAGIVRNAARNRRRRHALARPHDALRELVSDEPSSQALLEHAEDCMRLRGCVNRLCGSQRAVVMMRLLEERDGEDVAVALGLRRGYVDVLLHRARASLLVCMTEGELER